MNTQPTPNQLTVPTEPQQPLQKKKKPSKKLQSVPTSNLGFRAPLHADLIDPRNLKSIRRLARKKKYTVKSDNKNFMMRLRMVIDVNDLPEEVDSRTFRVRSKTDWKCVRKVYYRSREKIYCSICLEEEIVAPQITYCGHIYCFHCILMHFQISKLCYSCPVCKQPIDTPQLKPCEPHHDPQPTQSTQITLSLKLSQYPYIYDPQTLEQDQTSTSIIRMRTKGIIPFYERELEQIKAAMGVITEKERQYGYLVEAMKIVTERIALAMEVKGRGELRGEERMRGDVVVRVLGKNGYGEGTEGSGSMQKQQKSQPNKPPTKFYQQSTNSLTFLHTLSKPYLPTPAPSTLTSTILHTHQLDLSSTPIPPKQRQQFEYKQLLPFIDNGFLQIHLVVIDVREFVSEERYRDFLRDVEEYEREIERVEREEEAEGERLRREYEEERKYLRKLKEQEQAQYYFDVLLPPSLDPAEMVDQEKFPSLIGQQSRDSRDQEASLIGNIASIKSEDNANRPMLSNRKKLQSQKQKQKNKFDLTKQTQSFPDLMQLSQVQQIKSEDSKKLPNISISNLNLSNNQQTNTKIINNDKQKNKQKQKQKQIEKEKEKEKEKEGEKVYRKQSVNENQNSNKGGRKKKKKKQKFIDVTYQFMFNREEPEDYE